jgi:hypothetical protein
MFYKKRFNYFFGKTSTKKLEKNSPETFKNFLIEKSIFSYLSGVISVDNPKNKLYTNQRLVKTDRL